MSIVFNIFLFVSFYRYTASWKRNRDDLWISIDIFIYGCLDASGPEKRSAIGIILIHRTSLLLGRTSFENSVKTRTSTNYHCASYVFLHKKNTQLYCTYSKITDCKLKNKNHRLGFGARNYHLSGTTGFTTILSLEGYVKTTNESTQLPCIE